MMNSNEKKGGNSDLDGKYWNCPDYVINSFKDAIKSFDSINKDDKKPEGYKRAKGIIENKKIEYKQLKRIKNWFDTFEGNHNDIEYKLNGGKTMENWVNSTLNRETQAVKAPKKIKSETGLTNQFIKQHSKDNSKVNKNTLKMKLPNISKDVVGQVWRGKPVYEELLRIQELIIYESKI